MVVGGIFIPSPDPPSFLHAETVHQSGIAHRFEVAFDVLKFLKGPPASNPLSDLKTSPQQKAMRSHCQPPFWKKGRGVLSRVPTDCDGDGQTQSLAYRSTVPPGWCRVGRRSAPRPWSSLRFYRRITKFDGPEDSGSLAKDTPSVSQSVGRINWPVAQSYTHFQHPSLPVSCVAVIKTPGVSWRTSDLFARHREADTRPVLGECHGEEDTGALLTAWRPIELTVARRPPHESASPQSLSA